MSEISQRVGGVGVLSSLDLLMIGSWMKWRASCYVCMGRDCIGMRKIRCFGRRQRVASSLLSLSTKP